MIAINSSRIRCEEIETQVWKRQGHTVNGRQRYPILVCALMVILCFGSYAFAADSRRSREPLTNVVERFTKAQQDFDRATLRSLTAPMYREVSPKGTWYGRDTMLDFYAAANRTADTPEMSISEVDVRTFGDVAIELARVKYVLNGSPIALKATFVAKMQGKSWKIVSVHYTKEANR